jgi:hypothetical protein
MRTKITGKYISSTCCYFIGQKISFRYDAEKNFMIVEMDIELTKEFMKLWSFDIEDFSFKRLK